jgi:hypothetical protein
VPSAAMEMSARRGGEGGAGDGAMDPAALARAAIDPAAHT